MVLGYLNLPRLVEKSVKDATVEAVRESVGRMASGLPQLLEKAVKEAVKEALRENVKLETPGASKKEKKRSEGPKP